MKLGITAFWRVIITCFTGWNILSSKKFLIFTIFTHFWLGVLLPRHFDWLVCRISSPSDFESKFLWKLARIQLTSRDLHPITSNYFSLFRLITTKFMWIWKFSNILSLQFQENALKFLYLPCVCKQSLLSVFFFLNCHSSWIFSTALTHQSLFSLFFALS